MEPQVEEGNRISSSARPEERPEAGLLEVAVRGERVVDRVLSHDLEGDAVHQTPALVRPPPEELQSAPIQIVRDGDDLHPGIAIQRIEQPSRVLPLPRLGKGVPDFQQDRSGGDDPHPGTLDIDPKLEGFVVKAVRRSGEGDGVGGVEEEPAHSGKLPAAVEILVEILCPVGRTFE